MSNREQHSLLTIKYNSGWSLELSMLMFTAKEPIAEDPFRHFVDESWGVSPSALKTLPSWPDQLVGWRMSFSQPDSETSMNHAAVSISIRRNPRLHAGRGGDGAGLDLRWEGEGGVTTSPPALPPAGVSLVLAPPVYRDTAVNWWPSRPSIPRHPECTRHWGGTSCRCIVNLVFNKRPRIKVRQVFWTR